MATKKDEIAVQQQQALAVPQFMQAHRGQGVENLPADAVEIPRIKLLQALNPEVTEFDEAKQGHFWHHMIEQDLGSRLRIVPVYVDQSFILWRPRKSGGGILARAADGIHWSPDHGEFSVTLENGKLVTWTLSRTVASSGLAEWGTMDPSDSQSPPAATRMYNVVVVLPDLQPELSPVVVTLQRSAIGVARKFVGKLKISQAPSFGQYYTMEAVKDRNNQNQEYWTYKFTMAGLVSDEAEYEKYHATYEAFKKMGLRIKDIEGLQDEEPTPAEPTKF